MDIYNTPINQIVSQFRLDSKQGKSTDWADEIFLSGISYTFHNEFKRQLKEDSSKDKKHVYMLTYTVDPNKYNKGDDDKIEELIIAQKDRKALEIVTYAYVKESCKNGMPHWHALIVTKRPLKKDRFNYYISKYGNIDISKNKAQITTEIINYMSKTGEITYLK